MTDHLQIFLTLRKRAKMGSGQERAYSSLHNILKLDSEYVSTHNHSRASDFSVQIHLCFDLYDHTVLVLELSELVVLAKVW